MSRKRILAGALGLVALTLVAETSVFAAPATAAPTSTPAPAVPATRQTAHASLRLDVRGTKAWVGQALPVTLQAYFRGAEGVTLEGTPQLTSSSGIFTSDLSREPRQSTEVIGGEPVLVATWTGTVTPSSAAPLVIVAELPVQIRYREAAPAVEQASPFGDDPFAALGADPFDMSAINRFFQRSMQQSMASLGRVRQEAVSLRTTARPIDVQDVPTANQPESFKGAIGKFNLKASVSSTHARVSEPVTLRVIVDGDGDLDRVDLGGVATSDTWKAYPPKSTLEAPSKGKRGRKVFEQVLVPLRGGDLSVPAVALTSFDPDSSRYVTRETQPLAVTVEGTAVAAELPANDVAPASTPVPATMTLPVDAPPDAGPPVVPHAIAPARVALWLSPLVPLIAVAAYVARARRKRAERAIRRTMRKAASQGDAVPFYEAAHALIETRLSERWGVRPEDVSAHFIRERLGSVGEPLAEVLAADEALRFGRGRLENPDLVPLCSSIERSLGGAS
jgi:hypothetical protein